MTDDQQPFDTKNARYCFTVRHWPAHAMRVPWWLRAVLWVRTGYWYDGQGRSIYVKEWRGRFYVITERHDR